MSGKRASVGSGEARSLRLCSVAALLLAAIVLVAAYPYVYYSSEGVKAARQNLHGATGHQLQDDGLAQAKAHSGRPPTPEAKLDAAYFADLNRSYHETDGIVPRVKAHATELHGPSPYLNPMCTAVRQHLPGRIAVVGNGPLTSQDRTDIGACDKILRFNLMNNWMRFKEEVHVWVVRHSSEARKRYWGINNIKPPDLDRVINATQAIWLVGGGQEDADLLAKSLPSLLQHNLTLLPLQPWTLTYALSLGQQGGWPSTGFIAINALRFCLPDTTLHLFGMNWSPRIWKGHMVKQEQQWVASLQRRGLVTVHATACQGLRECGRADIDNSCHWSSDNRYLCLMPERTRKGSKLRWLDKTDHILGERMLQTEV